MDSLSPNWNQKKPSSKKAQAMCSLVSLNQTSVSEDNLVSIVQELNRSHIHGGAFLAAFEVGSNSDFDWFASRNRLLEFDILRILLARVEVQDALPALQIADFSTSENTSTACSIASEGGFELASTFLFDGQLSQVLFNGGAYGSGRGDGRAEKEAALRFCDTAFRMRFSEVSYYKSHSAWTPWFESIAWDWTAVLFDRRLRKLWILAVTDTD